MTGNAMNMELHFTLNEAAHAQNYKIYAAILSEKTFVIVKNGNELVVEQKFSLYMGTRYHPFQIALTDDQKERLQKVVAARMSVSLRLKPEQIGRGDSIHLTATQINHLQKAAAGKRGAELTISKTQTAKLARSGGNLFSLVQPFITPAAKAVAKELGKAGISFAADKVLKKIFGKEYGPRAVELYRLERRLTPAQRKTLEKYLVGKKNGSWWRKCTICRIFGEVSFHRVPLAIDLVKKMLGKGMHVGPSR